MNLAVLCRTDSVFGPKMSSQRSPVVYGSNWDVHDSERESRPIFVRSNRQNSMDKIRRFFDVQNRIRYVFAPRKLVRLKRCLVKNSENGHWYTTCH